MIGLAQMAWKLAWTRAQPNLRRMADEVSIERDTIEEYDANRWCTPGCFPASREYYRICDRIARGEAP